MASQSGIPAGNSGMSEQNNTALPDASGMIGDIAPLVGRIARQDVTGYFGFPIIKRGEAITLSIAERAQSMARLFELIAATEER